ncbi:competence protein CoiA family protein [Janibacter sp. G349]|uniref:competence protein CoiA family protein n=2 Tax=Janibacter sp. G349 TaxID=3405424 RepID=UPI003D28E6D1
MMRHRQEELPWNSTITAEDLTKFAVLHEATAERVFRLPYDGANQPVPGSSSNITVKEWVRRGAVHCLVEGCGPFQTVRRNSTKHDCFAHARGGQAHGHPALESAAHRAGKAGLAAWLTSELGDELRSIVVDEEQVQVDGERRTPDVLATLADGRRIVIEFQHSPGSPKDVEQRTRFYRRQGYALWWFWGPSSGNFRRYSAPTAGHRWPTTERIDAQEALARADVIFHWFDPTRALVGTPFHIAKRLPQRTDEEWTQLDPPELRRWYEGQRGHQPAMLVDTAPLERCSVDLRAEVPVFLTPAIRRIREGRRQEDILRAAARARRRRSQVRAASRPASAPRIDTCAPLALTKAEASSTEWSVGALPQSPSPLLPGPLTDTHVERPSPLGRTPAPEPQSSERIQELPPGGSPSLVEPTSSSLAPGQTSPTPSGLGPARTSSPGSLQATPIEGGTLPQKNRQRWHRRLLAYFGIGGM